MIEPHQSAYLGRGLQFIGQICCILKYMAYLANLREILMMLSHWFQAHHKGEKKPKRLSHTSPLPSVQSWVSRELDFSLGGEKLTFVMLYTHMECLRVMHVIAHMWWISARSRLYVQTSMMRDSHWIRTCVCTLQRSFFKIIESHVRTWHDRI